MSPWGESVGRIGAATAEVERGRRHIGELARRRVADSAQRSPARFAIVVFTSLIAIVTVLLMLPVAAESGTRTPVADALFTAVSVICVTGLSTVDMATHWSPFGHLVIYLGVQVGGIGVLTLASILGLVVTRRLGLRSRLMAASDTNPLRAHAGPVPERQAVRLSDVGGLLRTVALSAMAIEGVIGALLVTRLVADRFAFRDAFFDGFYYSAMAFTNTGFTPNAAGLAPLTGDYVALTLIMVAVILGSIGFPVIFVIIRDPRHPRRWSLHTKLTLVTSGILLALGTVLYLVLEYDNPRTFGRDDAGATVFQSLFLSAMTRSGGFSTIDIAHLHDSSLLVSDMLM